MLSTSSNVFGSEKVSDLRKSFNRAEPLYRAFARSMALLFLACSEAHHRLERWQGKGSLSSTAARR
jgi:hypothetical protein